MTATDCQRHRHMIVRNLADKALEQQLADEQLSVDFWYFLISRSATVPGRQRCGFCTAPGAACFLPTPDNGIFLPPIDLPARLPASCLPANLLRCLCASRIMRQYFPKPITHRHISGRTDCGELIWFRRYFETTRRCLFVPIFSL